MFFQRTSERRLYHGRTDPSLDLHAPCLVTGAAQGIGLACVKGLAAQGHRVVLVDRSPLVVEVADDLRLQGIQAQGIVADLSNTDQIATCMAKLSEMGGCDILVNNAGIHPKPAGAAADTLAISLADWEAVMRINTTAPFLLCQAALVTMKAKGWGRIINMASRAGRTYSDRAGAHYCASKGALISLTRKIAGDYGAYGITANCIAPGQVETPLASHYKPEILAAVLAATPVRRLGTANDIAAAVCYLASDSAAYTTGSVLDVNGGTFMG